MSRNQHHRERDHFGLDEDTFIATTSGVGGFPPGTVLHDVLSNAATVGLSINLDGLANPILTGNRGWVEVPFKATIVAARMLSDQVSNTTVDIWKTSYANYPPDAGDSICASSKLVLAGAAKSSNALTGWTTAIAAGDILWFHVDSNDLSTLLAITLTLARS